MGALRGSAALVAGVLVWVTFALVTAPGAEAGPPANAVAAPGEAAVSLPQRSARQVRQYWTPERMRAAVPIEQVLPRLTVSATDDGPTTRPTEQAAPQRVRAPRTTGKLFFTDGGTDFVCSAATIKSRKRNQVITAGHCAHSGPNVPILQQPHYFSDWMFVPRYRNGRAPYGRWVGRRAWALPGWREQEAFRFDQAIVSFRKTHGRRLVDVVGGNEVVFGESQRNWGVRIWGWPAEPPFDGEIARRCDGRTTRFEDSNDAAMHQCALNGGASGGPWFLPRGRTANTGRIWAVTSRRLLDRPVLLAVPIPGQVRQLIRAANR